MRPQLYVTKKLPLSEWVVIYKSRCFITHVKKTLAFPDMTEDRTRDRRQGTGDRGHDRTRQGTGRDRTGDRTEDMTG